MSQIRLQKYLSGCGIASRRKAEELIRDGRVRVNGKVSGIGDKIDPKKDSVTLNGKKIRPAAGRMYIMLNKPRGYITTMNDEMGRKCVAQLIQGVNSRVYPVGRLDRESEGLLLFTDDGEFANAMTHPTRHVPKTYRVTVRAAVTDAQVSKLSEGVVVDGRQTAPCEVKALLREDGKDGSGRSVLEIVLREGRNRQIRKMCEAVGIEVARLKRTAVGAVKLGMLPQGKWRELTAAELDKLKAIEN